MRWSAVRAGTRFRSSVTRHLILQVWIDRERFTAVLVHLIRNAQEATARDGSVGVAVAAAEVVW